jgi:hypothetical protein
MDVGGGTALSQHLAEVFALLMRLAFLIDPVQQRCNPLFRKAWEKKGPTCALWEAVRHWFASLEVSSMAEIYQGIAFGCKRPTLKTLIDPKPGRSRPATSSSTTQGTSGQRDPRGQSPFRGGMRPA